MENNPYSPPKSDLRTSKRKPRKVFLGIVVLALIGLAFITYHFYSQQKAGRACNEGVNQYERASYLDAIHSLSLCLSYRLEPESRAAVLEMRARSFAELKEFAQAAKDQREAISIQAPKDVWPLVMLGSYYRGSKNYDLSLLALNEAKKYDEDGPKSGPGMAVYYHTGLTLFEAGRYQDAVSAYTQGLQKQPTYGFAYFHRGLAYEALGELKNAETDFTRALELTDRNYITAEMHSKRSKYKSSIPSSPNRSLKADAL